MFHPSSSLVLIRPYRGSSSKLGYQVLMAKRSSKGSFSSSYVFPGGNLAKSDKDPYWLSNYKGSDRNKALENFKPYEIAALRETFEETGVLYGVKKDLISTNDKESLRKEAIEEDSSFLKYFKDNKLEINLNQVKYISEWLTPTKYPKRFATKFFIGVMEEDSTSFDSIDNKEITKTTWVEPNDILNHYYNHPDNIIFFPPQVYILTSLKQNFKNYYDLIAWYHTIPTIHHQLQEYHLTDDESNHTSYTTPWVTPYLPHHTQTQTLPPTKADTEEFKIKTFILPNDQPNHPHRFDYYIKSKGKQFSPTKVILHKEEEPKPTISTTIFNPFSTPNLKNSSL